MSAGKSLNGGNTRPMSATAREMLAKIKVAPIPAQEINPGVVDRLLREGCVELVNLPSPYKTVRRPVSHLRYVEGK